ncbi:DNA cytosine methyltransferase [Enterococcus hulanensis]|uniref:DNA cytosine methyltransferase n=1 Tax=Enterococcus hulanensis TaxID=2559929 RepID=UPI0010F99EFB|nr:DNA cytosine methyltransferase [Enterococcus hulanensis]
MVKRKTVSEIIVDNFAGGGGASTGIELAIGRSVDIAINHDQDAIAMHEANHPNTKHYCEDVFDVDPRKAAAGRPVALVWLSPDCKHFSKAKGKTPVNKKIRGLAWVGVRWAATVKPRVMILENVEEFKTWGPLIMTENGLMPDPKRKGHTFKSFIRALKRQGYHVEFRELRACDYGAPTTRKRFFMVARCDGRPIVWPEPTHGPRNSEEVKSGKLKPYHSAAECIDWSLPGNSIFGRKKPLSPNTLRRIARGLKKFVIDNPEPFIVTVNHAGDQFRGQSIKEPLHTVTSKNGYGVVSPYITRIGQTGFGGDRLSYPLTGPLTTITTKAEHCLISPTLIQMGYGDPEGKRVLNLDNPLGTITAGGNKFGLATAWVKKDYNTSIGDDLSDPLSTITSQSNHHSLMTAHLAVNNTGHPGTDIEQPLSTITTGGHHMLISSFLSKYYGGNYKGAGVDLRDPTDTVTSVDHHSIVSAFISKTYGGQTRSVASDAQDPLHTVTMRGGHSVVEVEMEKEAQRDLEIQLFFEEYYDKPVFGDRETAFLTKYYGSDIGQKIDDPLHTIPTKDRFGLIRIEGQDYKITDITLRMLQPNELAKAQGVPDTYVLDKDKDGKKISKAKQVARIGNMVVPHCAEALVRANLPELCSDSPYEEQVELLNADFGWSG